MFRHVVMFEWAEGVTDTQKRAVRDAVDTLAGQIPHVRAYRYGDDAGLGPDNFDFVVVADFDDAAGYVAYRDHPVHQAVVTNLIRPLITGRAALQHEWSAALPPDLPG